MKNSVKLLFVFIIALSCHPAEAQTSNIDVVGGGTGLTDYAGFHEPKGILAKKKEMAYEDVDGNSFWSEGWHPAILEQFKGGKFRLRKIKLNFYTNDIHFLNNKNEEYLLTSGVIQKIVFIDEKDTSKVLARFEKFKETHDVFVEVMNSGETQLLKSTHITLRKMEYNQFRNESRFRFIPNEKYFIRHQNVITKLSSLSKSAVLEVMKPNTRQEEWLKTNKNKLRNEKEVVAFFTFCNSIESKE
ncbi:MAG: hypothetical protein JST43_13100 [Bacteroidetes bacterium]|nr:hypothetical protein [Bacteroidota bacterium]MBS1541543.1 hypothetical protein [Bacteroidota bacterium]